MGGDADGTWTVRELYDHDTTMRFVQEFRCGILKLMVNQPAHLCSVVRVYGLSFECALWSARDVASLPVSGKVLAVLSSWLPRLLLGLGLACECV